MIARKFELYNVKNLGEIPTASPHTGASYRGRVGSNGDFRPTFRYISETVQDRDIVTIEH